MKTAELKGGFDCPNVVVEMEGKSTEEILEKKIREVGESRDYWFKEYHEIKKKFDALKNLIHSVDELF